MEMKCPRCGAEGGWPPYTCGACGSVVVECRECDGRGVLVRTHTPALRPRFNAREDASTPMDTLAETLRVEGDAIESIVDAAHASRSAKR